MDCPIERPGKILVPEQTSLSSFVVAYSDLDINKHMNSAKYVEHIIDALPIEAMGKTSPFRYEIEYIEECFWNEEITIEKAEVSESEYIITLKKKDGSIACKSRLFFK